MSSYCKPEEVRNLLNNFVRNHFTEFIYIICSLVQGGKINHPIHLHGYGFQVVNMGTKNQLQSGQTAFRNATHLPVVKDTVIIPSGGFAKIRFKACNPGYWFFHCHFEFHMYAGMALTLKVGDDTDMVKPPDNFPTCGTFLTPAYDTYGDYV